MAECARISADLEVDCNNQLKGGTKDLGWIVNYDDWSDAVITRNVTNPRIIEDIVLPSGAFAYKVEGQNNSILPKSNNVKSRFLNQWNHEVNFYVFKIDPATKLEIEKAGNGRFVFVAENKFRSTTGNTSFEVYGGGSGLVIPDGGAERDPGNAETQGAYNIILRSSEDSLESNPPETIFITDYLTSKAVITALES
jgi:hypothetical protein